MNRVIVTKCMVGLFHMQICAVKDATDKEVLLVCNKENPSGTTAGWGKVIRKKEEPKDNHAPTQCDDYPNRIHLLAVC